MLLLIATGATATTALSVVQAPAASAFEVCVVAAPDRPCVFYAKQPGDTKVEVAAASSSGTFVELGCFKSGGIVLFTQINGRRLPTVIVPNANKVCGSV